MAFRIRVRSGLLKSACRVGCIVSSRNTPCASMEPNKEAFAVFLTTLTPRKRTAKRVHHGFLLSVFFWLMQSGLADLRFRSRLGVHNVYLGFIKWF